MGSTCLTRKLRPLSPILLIANVLSWFGVLDVLNGMSIPGDILVHDSELKNKSNVHKQSLWMVGYPIWIHNQPSRGTLLYSCRAFKHKGRKKHEDQNTRAFIPEYFPWWGMCTACDAYWKFYADVFDITTQQHWFAVLNWCGWVGNKHIVYWTGAALPRPTALTMQAYWCRKVSCMGMGNFTITYRLISSVANRSSVKIQKRGGRNM